jgi:hypothetical protein
MEVVLFPSAVSSKIFYWLHLEVQKAQLVYSFQIC